MNSLPTNSKELAAECNMRATHLQHKSRLHPSISVLEDRVIARQFIPSGTLLMMCPPILTYRRPISEGTLPMLCSLIRMSDEEITYLYSSISSLYPRTREERQQCLRRVYLQDVPPETIDQKEHIIIVCCAYNSFQEDGNRMVYLEASKLNHSCAPNCCYNIEEQSFIVATSRDVQAGEELTISYCIGPFEAYMSGRERRNITARNVYFWCQCCLCRGRCNTCDRPDAAKMCQRCKVVLYCSLECQKRDWSDHKHICPRLK